MANNRSGNVIHVDTAASAVVETRNMKLLGILLTSAAVGDTLVLRETSDGGDKITVKNGIDESTLYLDLSKTPIVFGEGIYIQTLTSGAKAMLIISQSGTAE